MIDETERVDACDLCGSSRRRTVFEERGFPIVRCESCGLVYVTPRFTQEKIARLFDAFSRGDTDDVRTETGLPPPWEAESPREKERYTECLRYVKERLPPDRGPRLLDVGAGNGNLVIRARAMGFRPFAFDVMPAHVERLQHEMGIEGAVAPSLEAAGLPAAGFDAVTLWDVIEHLPRPVETLREIGRVLRPGGLLAVKTPNYHWLILKARLVSALKGSGAFERMGVMSGFGLFAPEVHLYNFTPRTLERLLDRTGFRLLRIDLGRSSEPSSRLSLLLHDVVTCGARALHGMSLGRLNVNPSLTAFAERRG